MNNPPINISVIIPSYQTAQTIGATLKGIERQDALVSYEVIVVDCSETTAVKNICEQFSLVQYIHQKQRFNPGIGRNIGANHALGELLVFIDADVILDSKALQEAWRFYKKDHTVFGGAIVLKYTKEQYIAAHLEHLYFNHESQPQRPVCQRKNLSSALMVIDKNLFIEHNGFANIARMQDTEFTERLRKTGSKLFFTPAVIGQQLQSSILKSVFRKIFITGQNLYFIRYNTNLKIIKKVVFFVLLPVMGTVKIARIIGRQLRYNTVIGRFKVMLFSPLLCIAGLVWTFGFYQGILFNKGIRNER